MTNMSKGYYRAKKNNVHIYHKEFNHHIIQGTTIYQ
jgi:hypothetical protein